MKLIEHLIPVAVSDEKTLLINALNGLMDLVNNSVYDTILSWTKLGSCSPETEEEQALFQALHSRGYLVNNQAEEDARREEVVALLRNQHEAWKDDRKYVVFIMTYDCNFRCPYCFEGDECLKKGVISPEQIDSALKLVENTVEHICLFGGEPLLPETRSALEYLISKAPDKLYSMYTNGYYLLEFYDILSTVQIEKIVVTLDGEEQAHNSRRFLADGSPTFEKILLGIEKFLENGIAIHIRVNVDKENVESSTRLKNTMYERFAAFADSLFFEIAPIMGTTSAYKTDLLAEIYRSDLDYSLEERLKRSSLVEGSSLTAAFSGNLKQLRPMYCFCNAHISTVAFDPYGQMYSCLVSVGKENMSVGTYYPEMKFKKDSLYNRNIETIPQCRKCVYALLCGGGCSMALSRSENLYQPVCSKTRSNIHDLLPRLFQLEQDKAASMQNN